jgi:phenylacetate-CoA ligase
VVEFRIELRRDREMDDLRVLVECAADGEAAARVAQAVERELQRRLFLRIPCVAVPPGSLPRFELKARRLVRIASPA